MYNKMVAILPVLTGLVYVSSLLSGELIRESPASQFIKQYHGTAQDAERAHAFAKICLNKARVLLEQHDSCLGDKQKLRNEMNTLCLKAARGIADCILPSQGLLKHLFDQSKVLHVLGCNWNVPVTGRVPIEIRESNLGIHVDYQPRFAGGLLWYSAIKIVISPLWTHEGNMFMNADILEAFIAHEMHHIMSFDVYWHRIEERFLSPYGPCNLLRLREAQELEADVFACQYSNRAARGFLMSCAIYCSLLEQHNLTYKDEHLQPEERLALVQKYSLKKYCKENEFSDADARSFVSYKAQKIRGEQLREGLYLFTKTFVGAGAVALVCLKGLSLRPK